MVLIRTIQKSLNFLECPMNVLEFRLNFIEFLSVVVFLKVSLARWPKVRGEQAKPVENKQNYEIH